METRAVVCDLDDTLIFNGRFYDEAIDAFVARMGDLGFDTTAVRKYFKEYDVEMATKHGFAAHHFEDAMAHTYEYFCKQNGQTPNPTTTQMMYHIGYNAVNHEPEFMPGAENLLNTLREHGYRLYILTAGVLGVQRNKLSKLNLENAVDGVYIVGKKDKSTLLHICSLNNLYIPDTWMVGNSMRSDIDPAVQAGMRAILLDGYSWDYDTSGVQHVGPSVWRVKTLDEVAATILTEDVDSEVDVTDDIE